MSEAKHTPGSWTATRIISTTCGFIVSDSRGSVVARVQKIGVPKDGNFELPCEENANLIAAAPDLLAALKSIAIAMDDEVLVHDDQREAMRAATAAIAKATGQTS